MKMLREWAPYFIVMLLAVVLAIEEGIPLYRRGKAGVIGGGA